MERTEVQVAGAGHNGFWPAVQTTPQPASEHTLVQGGQTAVLQVHMGEAAAEPGREVLGPFSGCERVAGVEARMQARRPQRRGDLVGARKRLIPVVLDRDPDRRRGGTIELRDESGRNAHHYDVGSECRRKRERPGGCVVVAVVETSCAYRTYAHAGTLDDVHSLIWIVPRMAEPELDIVEPQTDETLERVFEPQRAKRIRVAGEPHRVVRGATFSSAAGPLRPGGARNDACRAEG